jgi:transforming growth factor-beta-induced protein
MFLLNIILTPVVKATQHKKIQHMKKVILALMFVATASMLISCGEDDNPTKQQLDDIIVLAQANGFNSLAAALTKVDLVDDLQGTGPFTVFAPTDAAFTALLSTIGQTSIDNVPDAVLERILLYHVVSGSVFSGDISAGNQATLEGSSVALNTDGGIKVNGASVIAPFDVEASNGVIHTVDAVLVPADILLFVNTVLEPAYFSNDFTTLVSAVVKADLVSTLLNTPNLTIFAPNNAAFTAAGINVDATSASDLVDVLAYHVLTSKVLEAGIPASATTFGGDDIYFSLTTGGAFINGSTQIIGTDIESGTGVVHVLNNVLMPPAGNIVGIASGDTNFSSLVAALERTTTEGETNLVDVLNGAGPFTVFAPTNAAFQALLGSNPEWTVLGDIPIGTLVDVLTYHVVEARAFSTDLAGAVDMTNQIGTVQGQNLTFDLTNLTINTSVDITATDIHATNGVIHVIDEVLVPQTPQ